MILVVICLVENLIQPKSQNSVSTYYFWCIIAIAFVSWTLWCALMAMVGQPFSSPPLRAVVRIGVIATPAIIFLSRYSGDRKDLFGFVRNSKIGIIVGLALASVHIAVLLCTSKFDFDRLPNSIAVWSNYLIFSPLAEELLFRRVAVDYFCQRHGNTLGILASAILFSLIHLPWWAFSGEYSTLQQLSLLLTLAVYGLVFGIAYRATGSTWASLIPHWTNNLVATISI